MTEQRRQRARARLVSWWHRLRGLDAGRRFALTGATLSGTVFPIVALATPDVLTPAGPAVLLAVAVLASPVAFAAVCLPTRDGGAPSWWGWYVTAALVAAGLCVADPQIRQYAAMSLLVGPVYVAMFAGRGRNVLACWLASSVGTLSIACRPPGDLETLVVRGLCALTVTGLLFGGFVLLLRQLRSTQAEADRAARHDPLTGLLNRRGLAHELPGLHERARRAGEDVAVLLCDLDHFKQVNDRFGHTVGDEVLTLAAKTVRQVSRPGDLCVRMGGEELLLVAALPAEGLAPLAERLRAAVADLPATRTRPAVTVSVGAASGPPLGTESVQELFRDLFRRADELLFTAKSSGRNRALTEPPPGTLLNDGGAPAPGTPSAPRPAHPVRPG
ncbi:GGDEF domain-containing protein [Kineococcus gynurae]|uniref:GGDEF domain-containing protein n=1 Tax=Kineococcus gynurae TaxID=452979 RepID=A0ABV5LQ89_9ACTN